MRIFRYFLYLLFVLAPAVAYAAGSSFDASACNVINVVTGTAGKVFAAFAIVATGVGFFTGKISWGLLIGVVAGIAVIFGAPSIVSAISGKPMFECQKGTLYVSDCEGASCYSCPMGFTGEDCDTCATGYAGVNCDTCADGYTGYNCSECDGLNGYYSAGNYCFKACSVSFTGIRSGTAVGPTTEPALIECDETGFAGFISYTCIDEVFEAAPGEVCGCEGNRGGANCDQCQEGYDLSTDCEELLEGYYMTSENGAQAECDVSSTNILGVDTRSLGVVIPDAGTIGCSVIGYDGTLNYNCVDSFFSYDGNCACAAGYLGDITDCASTCDTGNGYERDINTGECKKGCHISEPGLTVTWVDMTNIEKVVPCDSTNFEGDVVYTCDPDNSGFVKVEDNCSCALGYAGVDCLSCDEANGYSDDGNGNCLAGCTIDVNGSSVVWVSPTSSQLALPCDEDNYEGSVNYTCANNNFVTSDSCSCKVGYDLSSGCTSCDSANGYNDDGNGSCVAGCDISSLWNLIDDLWVEQGSTTLNCNTAPDGYNRTVSVNCNANNVTITSVNNDCVCALGYTGNDCSSCDSANGYSMQGGVCKSGCYVNMNGVSTNYWVNTTVATAQLSCSVGNYEGTINYTCDGTNFSTSDSCSCKTGYVGVDCNSCDTSNNYNLISGTCQKSCIVPGDITDMQVPIPGYVIQGSGSLACNNSNTPGINNRSSISYTCDGNGNFIASQTTCVCGVGYTGPNCDQIDAANGYVDDGNGNPVLSCSVSLSGISETYVTLGAGNLTCRVGNYEGSITYNCDSNRNLNASGSCSCKTGYAGSNCTTCADGYNMDGGVCKQQCTFNGQSGLVDGTKVNSGSNSVSCNETDFFGTVTYNCSDGSLTNLSSNCRSVCTGGSITEVGGKRIHTFTSGTGAFRCPENKNVEVLVVAGGGGGGGVANGKSGGGGGAGGVIHDSSYSVSAGVNINVVVGRGGSYTKNGENSSFGSLTAIGGGASSSPWVIARSGGSGGGEGNANRGAGSGTAGQGHDGGQGYQGSSNSNSFAGGGGGAGGVGGDADANNGGDGGIGLQFSISGTPRYYAGGGGAHNHKNVYITDPYGTPGSGGLGGGGDAWQNGEPNTGGGGGNSASGGSGVVIVSY